jgi:predicted transglutaminase-like cysteine proteinase
MFRRLGLAIVILMVISCQTIDNRTPEPSSLMRVFGRAIPPKGFVEFCATHPAACNPSNVKGDPVPLTPKAWRDLLEVNHSVNNAHSVETDASSRGVTESWNYPKGVGDCEDFALEKRRLLIQRGWPSNALLITIVNVPLYGPHAVLVVSSAEGDYVLDILDASIRAWSEVNYRWLTRQSKDNPRAWMHVGV